MAGKRKRFFTAVILVIISGLSSYFVFTKYQEFTTEIKREKLLGAIGGIPQTSFNPDYPRLFNQYLLNDLSYPGVISALKNWDYVILSERVPSSETNLLRSMNANIKIGRYFSPTSVYEAGNQSSHPYTRDYYNKV